MSRQERYEAAAELFERVGEHGDEVIRNNLRDQLRLLAEHVVERSMLNFLSEILEPIRTLDAARHHNMLKHHSDSTHGNAIKL